MTILNPETVRVTEGSNHVIHTPVMHMTGAEQQDSPYGLSVLEPFVHLQTEREIMQETLEVAQAWNQIPVPEAARTRARGNVPLARRRLRDIENKITATLGASGSLQVQPPAGLYFPGYELMAPAAAGLLLVARESPGGAAAGEQG